MDAAALKLQPQRIGQGFEGEFGSAVCAAPRSRNEAEHGGALHDPPPSVSPHGRNDPPREIVSSDHVHLELVPQGMGWDVLDRSRLTVGGVVEKGIEAPACTAQGFLGAGGDRVRIGKLEVQRFEPILLGQTLQVIRLAGGGQDAPAARLHHPRRCEPDAG